jgi:hypothetical protein
MIWHRKLCARFFVVCEGRLMMAVFPCRNMSPVYFRSKLCLYWVCCTSDYTENTARLFCLTGWIVGLQSSYMRRVWFGSFGGTSCLYRHERRVCRLWSLNAQHYSNFWLHNSCELQLLLVRVVCLPNLTPYFKGVFSFSVAEPLWVWRIWGWATEEKVNTSRHMSLVLQNPVRLSLYRSTDLYSLLTPALNVFA